MNWNAWLLSVRDILLRGDTVTVPLNLPHPVTVGFQLTTLAEGAGQIANWAHPLDDGSRLHAHQFANGRFDLHRDRIDPDRGPLQALAHGLAESRAGRFILAVLLISAVVKIARA